MVNDQVVDALKAQPQDLFAGGQQEERRG